MKKEKNNAKNNNFQFTVGCEGANKKNEKQKERQPGAVVLCKLKLCFYKLFLQKQRIQVLAAGYTELGIKCSRIGLDGILGEVKRQGYILTSFACKDKLENLALSDSERVLSADEGQHPCYLRLH